jgi:hypothetical protein
MRLHHDVTLELLDVTTVQLGSQFRKFQAETCNTVTTLELPREVEARARRAAKAAAKSSGSQNPTSNSHSQAIPARKQKRFSLSTPKYHALGHYAWAIRRYGTTDSYTSEIVRFIHHHIMPD